MSRTVLQASRWKKNAAVFFEQANKNNESSEKNAVKLIRLNSSAVRSVL